MVFYDVSYFSSYSPSFKPISAKFWYVSLESTTCASAKIFCSNFKVSKPFFECFEKTHFFNINITWKFEEKKNSQKHNKYIFKKNISKFCQNWSRAQLIGWKVTNVKFKENWLKNERKRWVLLFFCLMVKQLFQYFVNFIRMVYCSLKFICSLYYKVYAKH